MNVVRNITIAIKRVLSTGLFSLEAAIVSWLGDEWDEDDDSLSYGYGHEYGHEFDDILDELEESEEEVVVDWGTGVYYRRECIDYCWIEVDYHRLDDDEAY